VAPTVGAGVGDGDGVEADGVAEGGAEGADDEAGESVGGADGPADEVVGADGEGADGDGADGVVEPDGLRLIVGPSASGVAAHAPNSNVATSAMTMPRPRGNEVTKGNSWRKTEVAPC
jgi:hypothetical protein